MWRAGGDGSVEGDDETTNISNSLKKRRIAILRPTSMTISGELESSRTHFHP